MAIRAVRSKVTNSAPTQIAKNAGRDKPIWIAIATAKIKKTPPDILAGMSRFILNCAWKGVVKALAAEEANNAKAAKAINSTRSVGYLRIKAIRRVRK